jgi:hypothetical protein
VWHELAYHLKEKRLVMCRELLKLLQMEENFRFARLVTEDEAWLYLNSSHTHMWSVSDDELPVCARLQALDCRMFGYLKEITGH